jgi:hypothetical protein
MSPNPNENKPPTAHDAQNALLAIRFFLESTFKASPIIDAREQKKRDQLLGHIATLEKLVPKAFNPQDHEP